VAPLSLGDVALRRPTLRWALPTGYDGAVLELCRDRACAMVIESLAVSGSSARPSADLPARSVVYWRLRGRVGGATDVVYSPTWLFHVPAVSASGGVDTSANPHLDLDGDGFDDVAVGARFANSQAGVVYVYMGGAASPPLNAAPVALVGPSGSYGFGETVAIAGDVNGDGYGDLAVASPGSGRVYVYRGSPSGVATVPIPVTIGGITLAGAGDVNGDGYADIIVGIYDGNGSAHVYHGSASGLTATAATSLAGRDGMDSYFGLSVASAGDVNGDGYSDVIVGAFGANNRTGAAYVYLGSVSGVSTAPATSLVGSDGTNMHYGVAVASAGDVNGDGYSDVVVANDYAGGYGGAAYVYLGSAVGLPTVPARSLTGSGQFGQSVASAGDVNGDGFGDLVVGGLAANGGVGEVRVFAGSASGVVVAPAIVLPGRATGQGYFGRSVVGAGDVNGDGYADVFIGAEYVNNRTGAAYLFLGSTTGIPSTPASTLLGRDGQEAHFGFSVASVFPASAVDVPRSSCRSWHARPRQDRQLSRRPA
jgi:hypothetical protein